MSAALKQTLARAALLGAAVTAVLAAAGGGFGPLAAGAAVGAGAGLVTLALRWRGVSASISKQDLPARWKSALFYSFAKLGVAFAAMALGAAMGPAGAVGALAGLLTSNAAAVWEGLAAREG